MFSDIFIFELRYRFARPATYIYFALLAIVSLLLIASGSTPASDKVFHNSPYVIANLQVLISIFGILIASAVMGVPIYRDLEHKTATFLFSYPISDKAYFMGRFWGSFVTLLFISLGSLVGIYLGSIIGPGTGWTDATRYGPNTLINYLHPWLTLVLPNLWLAGTLFFALIIFTRSIKSIYSGGIMLFIIYLLANFLTQDIENKNLVELLDPFGLNTFELQTRYITPFEQNTFLLAFSGNLMMNRLLWSGVGLLFFLAAYFRFDFVYFFNQKEPKALKPEVNTTFKSQIGRLVSTDFSSGYQWNSMLTLTKLEISNITKDVYFRSILLGGVVFLILDFWIGQTLYSVPNMPATSVLMEFKGYDYNIFVFIIIVFFTGETIHRNNSTGYAIINDTFPVKDWVVILSKFLGISFICLLLATLPIFIGIIIQTLKGYYNYQISTYLIDSYLITFPDYLQMVMLVFAIHLVINNKFAGHATSIGIWVIMIVFSSFARFDFNMFFFSYKPSYMWSDMNGLGHFVEPLIWFNIYWTSIGLFLILFFSIFFTRGTENSFRSRLHVAKKRLTAKTTLASFVFLIIGLITGGFIYNNVVYKNNYITPVEGEKRQAAYEKQLKQYEYLPQPKIISINLKADIYPYERDAYFDASIILVNKTEVNIDSLHLQSADLTSFQVVYDGDTLPYRIPLKLDPPKFQVFKKSKPRESYKIVALPQTMLPGDSLEINMVTTMINDGFPNGGYGREIVHNGTFIGGGLPSIGYSAQTELTNDEKRKKYDLAPKEDELPRHEDEYGTRTLLFSSDADFIQFEATISTVPEQIAVSPGYLQKEWTEGDRRYFHYIQDTPIQSFFNIVSAEYEVLHDQITLDTNQDIAIEIYFQKGHEYNLDRFVAAYKDGLEYFSEMYSPFQFRQMRILEFPRYAGFAQSFPNTVPFSESFGWIADFSDPNDFDYVYFVTAHELAHQWWGHQVVPNYTRGSNLISEALAEYSALILTERAYGKDNMKRFLKNELDRYLSGRANEGKKENAFINCNRAYQWYYKGSLILYALRDYIGDEAIDKALRNFTDEYALRQVPPYPGSPDLLRHLQEYTPDSLKYYLDDTWNKITLYENKVEEVSSEKIENGDYLVTLKVKSQKVYADSLGRKTPAQYEGDYIDIGIFANDGKDENGRTKTNALYLQKHKIKPGESTFTISVKDVPVRAGIDPLNKLIDRIPEDNIASIN